MIPTPSPALPIAPTAITAQPGPSSLTNQPQTAINMTQVIEDLILDMRIALSGESIKK